MPFNDQDHIAMIIPRNKSPKTEKYIFNSLQSIYVKRDSHLSCTTDHWIKLKVILSCYDSSKTCFLSYNFLAHAFLLNAEHNFFQQM